MTWTRAATLPVLLAAGCAGAPGGSTAVTEQRTDFGPGKVAWVDVAPQAPSFVPPVVYIHGWAGDGTVWGAQLEAMRGTARQIVIDLPGHGRSDAPRIDYSVATMADAVLAVMDAANEPCAILVAHSNGVITAREVLRKAPRRVIGLVLVDGPLELFIEDNEQARGLIRQLASREGPEIAARQISQMLPDTIPPELRLEFMQRAGSIAPRVLAATIESTLEPSLWQRDPIQVPTLVLNADQPVWTADYAERVRELIPGVDYRVLPDTAHFVMLDPPDRFNGILQEFCRGRERIQD